MYFGVLRACTLSVMPGVSQFSLDGGGESRPSKEMTMMMIMLGRKNEVPLNTRRKRNWNTTWEEEGMNEIISWPPPNMEMSREKFSILIIIIIRERVLISQ